MGTESQWRFADHSALQWIESVARPCTGFAVGPLPDKVFILHPLLEQVDGGELDEDRDEDDHSRLQTLRWEDYARRKNLPMFGGNGGQVGVPGFLRAAYSDPHVQPPGEGDIEHPATQLALFDILIRHSSAGEHTMCTAFLGQYFGPDPSPKQPDGQDNYYNVQRGPLGAAWSDLYDQHDFNTPPQNLWPDDHTWVLQTDLDGWMTAISGPVELIEDLLSSPVLEAMRLPPLN